MSETTKPTSSTAKDTSKDTSTASTASTTSTVKDAAATAAQSAGPGDSAEVQVASSLGVGEGTIKALRDDAGLNQLAGHAANLHAWSQSAGGKDFLDGEADRKKAAKADADRLHKAVDSDGLNDAEKKYVEAVDKA